MIQMAGLVTAGMDVGDAAVRTEMGAAYRTVCRMWVLNAEAFKSLGQMYVDDPRFTATYDKLAAGLAGYYRDAMPPTQTRGSTSGIPDSRRSQRRPFWQACWPGPSRRWHPGARCVIQP